MGSRYDDGYRSSMGRGPPPGNQWDSARFSRESEDRYRGPPPPVMERERGRNNGLRYEDPYPPRGARPAERFDDRYHREEQYGPPARRPERRYYDDDDYFDPRGPPPGGAMIPFRPSRPEPPPRLIRRQSSLDTFDRKPMRRHNHFDDHDDYRYREEFHSRPPPVIPIPVPPSRSPPRYRPRYAERDYEDIRIAEPDHFGDEEFRGYREREWTRERSRRHSASSSSSSAASEPERPKHKTYPRKGKTRMPKRLVQTKILIDLGYPYCEEGEMIIIEKALGKENIDEVVTLSREYREKEETKTIHIIKTEAPEEKATEEIVEKKITTVPISEAPRSVREWDNLKVELVEPSSPRRSKSKRRSHSRHVSRSRRSSSPREVIEKKIIREVSPRRHRSHSHHSYHRSHSHHRPHGHAVEYVERREVSDDDFGESNSIHAGPLALVIDRHPKGERDTLVRDEIRALEAERRALRSERVEIRKPSRYREDEREVVIERPAQEEVIEVKKDKKGVGPKHHATQDLTKTDPYHFGSTAHKLEGDSTSEDTFPIVRSMRTAYDLG